jgi:Spy/CpxP family protein refolding chaperone
MTAGYAQMGMTQSPEDRAKQLQKQLKLNADQTSKITTIYKHEAPRVDSVKKAAKGDKKAIAQGLVPVAKETSTKIKTLLTPDQAKAYDKLMSNKMDAMKKSVGGL